MSQPVILFSSCENPAHSGDMLYNGGYKLQALWVKLLRQHGHDAYRVTQDGTQLSWMIESVPCLSMAQASKIARSGPPVRVMTTWIVAEQTLQLTDHPYYFDAEIAHTMCGKHFEAIKRWLPRLAKVGTHSRTQQAWYMAMFGQTPSYIQEWSDSVYFKPDPAKRERGMVGFMHEGDHTMPHVKRISDLCRGAGVSVRFQEIGGSEAEVIANMQRCDVFLGMNIGKHPLWGEGCPRSAQESVHCGAMLISYDSHGNREYITDGYTGFIVKNNDPDLMAEKLIQVMRDAPLREFVRSRGVDFALNAFSEKGRYELIKEFLDL